MNAGISLAIRRHHSMQAAQMLAPEGPRRPTKEVRPVGRLPAPLSSDKGYDRHYCVYVTNLQRTHGGRKDSSTSEMAEMINNLGNIRPVEVLCSL